MLELLCKSKKVINPRYHRMYKKSKNETQLLDCWPPSVGLIPELARRQLMKSITAEGIVVSMQLYMCICTCVFVLMHLYLYLYLCFCTYVFALLCWQQ